MLGKLDCWRLIYGETGRWSVLGCIPTQSVGTINKYLFFGKVPINNTQCVHFDKKTQKTLLFGNYSECDIPPLIIIPIAFVFIGLY